MNECVAPAVCNQYWLNPLTVRCFCWAIRKLRCIGIWIASEQCEFGQIFCRPAAVDTSGVHPKKTWIYSNPHTSKPMMMNSNECEHCEWHAAECKQTNYSCVVFLLYFAVGFSSRFCVCWFECLALCGSCAINEDRRRQAYTVSVVLSYIGALGLGCIDWRHHPRIGKHVRNPHRVDILVWLGQSRRDPFFFGRITA